MQQRRRLSHHWVLLSNISGLQGFLLHKMNSLTHLNEHFDEHFELHEVLWEGAVAGGIIIIAIGRVSEVWGGFGRGDVGALGGVSSPLSAVIDTITEGFAVNLDEYHHWRGFQESCLGTSSPRKSSSWQFIDCMGGVFAEDNYEL